MLKMGGKEESMEHCRMELVYFIYTSQRPSFSLRALKDQLNLETHRNS